MDNKIVARVGISPVGSEKYRANRLRFHLLAYSIARQAQLNGREAEFLIRCDDTDAEKSNRSYLDAYLEVLYSLGVKADQDPYSGDREGNSLFQSERGHIYTKYLHILEEKSLVRKDDQGTIFFDTNQFSIRYSSNLNDSKLKVYDSSRGKMEIDIRSQLREDTSNGVSLALLPFPIVRANGSFLFHLTSPVDDGVLGVTHIVRDRDKLDLLAKQEMIRISLDLPPITYVHAPLLVNNEGKRFTSDQYYGDSTYQDFRSRGVLPNAIVSYLLSGFYGPSERFYQNIDEFANELDISRLHKANIAFSPSVLEQHNRKALLLSTLDEYRETLELYLKWKDPEAVLLIQSHPEIVNFLHEKKRSLNGSESIIRDLTFEGREEIEPGLELALKLVLSLQLDGNSATKESPYSNLYIENAKQNSKDLSLEFPSYCKALSYALIGRMSNINLRDAVNYFEGNKTIVERLENTSNHMRRK